VAAGGIADPAAARGAPAALVQAQAGDTVLTDLFDVGWPAPHRVLRNSTYERWVAAGRPPSGSRPGEGDQVARGAGSSIPRDAINLPRIDVKGDLEAMAMYAGQGVGAIAAEEPAGEIVERFYAALRR